jgi:hypothetical protein
MTARPCTPLPPLLVPPTPSPVVLMPPTAVPPPVFSPITPAPEKLSVSPCTPFVTGGKPETGRPLCPRTPVPALLKASTARPLSLQALLRGPLTWAG